MDSAREIRFDGWTLRPATGELSRAGRTVRLQSQPLQVLQALLEQPGEMVSREQLIARLWPRGIVEFDTALNSAVRRLRTALGDRADTPRYIETIPKLGYRFIARLEPTIVTDGVAVRSIAVPVAVDTRRRPPRAFRAWVAAVTLVALAAGLGAWTWRGPASPGAATVTGAIATSAAALEGVQQGRFLLQRRGPGDSARAREHFAAALRVDPRNARAWAGIASTWWIDTVEGRVSREVGLPRAREAAQRALAFDAGVAEAHLRLSNVAALDGDRATAEAHLRAAIRAEPGDPLVLSFESSAAAERGDFVTAAALQRRAVEADPLAVVPRHNLAVTLFVGGRYAEARTEILELLEIKPDADDELKLLLGQSLVLSGEPDAALAVASGLDDAAGRLQLQALAFHALGRVADSDAALRALSREPLGQRAYLLAEAHAFRGEADAAFASLREVLAARTVPCDTCWPVAWMPSLPLLRPLHADARWTAWVDSLRAQASG